MKCPECGKTLKKLSQQRWQYTECGLDHVYLEGVTVWHCDACKNMMPVIPHVQSLHDTIAEKLANKPGRLEGREAQYLRRYLRLRAVDFAELLETTSVTVSRWERKGNVLPATVDRYLRILHFLHKVKNRAMVNPHAAASRWLEWLKKLRGEIEDFEITIPMGLRRR
jgi:putative zinc finger/helix-turn-helix YgiT family protein